MYDVNPLMQGVGKIMSYYISNFDPISCLCMCISLIAHCAQNISIESFIYSPTDALVSCLKKTILKFTSEFTLNQLRHVSVLQLHHHQGAH
jgi:hypothetical protein